MDILRWLKKLRKKSKYLWRSGWQLETEVITLDSFGNSKEDKRKQVKPKNVMKELVAKKIKIDLSNLDDKIKAIQKRRDFMEYELDIATGDEDKVITWLKARKKYLKNKHLFNWNVTNQIKVDKLLKKYQLSMGTVNTYRRCIPAEALDEMEKFTKACNKVMRVTPLISIIGDKDETKKDPILLGHSPFGNFYYVLGAWDKEVEIMDELYG